MAAGWAFTLVTFISGIVISAVNPKAKATEVAVPSYLIGMVYGVLFGASIYAKKKSTESDPDRAVSTAVTTDKTE